MKFSSLRERHFFFSFPTALFSLIPFFLVTGPFLSDLSVSLISLIFLYYCLKKKNFSYFKNKYFYFFLIFWFYLIFNSLIINFNLDSLKISFFYFRYGIFVIAVSVFLNVNDKFIKYFFYCIFFCFVILILDGFYQYFNGENILGWERKARTSSFFGDEYILGSYLSRLWPIFFALSIFMFKQKDKFFILLILIFVLSEALIFLSGDRSAFFFINLSAVFVILFSQKLMKLRILTLISSVFLLVIISIINPTAKERVFDKTLQDMKVGNDLYIFSKQHTHHYLTAYKMFIDNKVFGVGVKNFRNFCGYEEYSVSKISCSTHPHNTYIQILTEIGIIGFLFLLFVLFYFCKYILKQFLAKLKGRYYFSDFEICILSGIAIYLWPFVPTGNFFSNWLTILLIINIPFLAWSRKRHKSVN